MKKHGPVSPPERSTGRKFRSVILPAILLFGIGSLQNYVPDFLPAWAAVSLFALVGIGYIYIERAWIFDEAIDRILALERVKGRISRSSKLDEDNLKLPILAKVEGHRWDKIGEIKYGYVEFSPFVDIIKAKPNGWGIDFVEELFEPLRIYPKRVNERYLWKDIVPKLVAGECDIIATPIFETYTRLSEIWFSAPLFFSDMGLYVSKHNFEGLIKQHIKFDELKNHSDLANFSFLTADEEISEKLASKYFPNSAQKVNAKGLVPDLLEEVGSSSGAKLAVFCDSYIASQQECVASGSVVNILERWSIAYPVAFALRPGDHHLKNLINLRLLTLGRGGGFLKLLKERQIKDGVIDTSAIDSHFTEQWPPVV